MKRSAWRTNASVVCAVWLSACGGTIAGGDLGDSAAQDVGAADADDGLAETADDTDSATVDAEPALDTALILDTAVDTSRDASETGCTPGGVVDGCSFSTPVPGSCCGIPGRGCNYNNGCGGTYMATCTAAGWAVESHSCGSPCASVPVNGAPCVGPLNCTFTSPCGLASAVCSATSSYWSIMTPACSGTCPTTEPAKVGDPCLSSGKCGYSQACGTQDTVYCAKGVVTQIDRGTCPSCPASQPVPASSCSSALTCNYVSACGGMDVATCAGVASKWSVLRGACPP